MRKVMRKLKSIKETKEIEIETAREETKESLRRRKLPRESRVRTLTYREVRKPEIEVSNRLLICTISEDFS
jgi:hypothetical protein